MLNSLLITGGGSAGSWKVRGHQLGRAVGAYTVKENATAKDIAEHRIVVVVKRCPEGLRKLLRESGKLIVWDCVDAYPQPNTMSREQAVAFMHEYALQLGAHHIVAATKRMAYDLGGVEYLQHHGWARGVSPVKQNIKLVAYEGDSRYIAEHRNFLDSECRRRGWRFEVNPPDITNVDVLVAFRGLQFDSYTSRFWKSGVKLANAQIAGIPFIGSLEAGYRETACGAELWAETPEEIKRAFDELEPQATREEIQRQFLVAAPTLKKVAREYERMLDECHSKSCSPRR
jgi:hypothetical protein